MKLQDLLAEVNALDEAGNASPRGIRVMKVLRDLARRLDMAVGALAIHYANHIIDRGLGKVECGSVCGSCALLDAIREIEEPPEQ